MLSLVLAAAGLVMPGAGDVSTMDPTMAYGAAPNMLLFAPVGGAGFDWVGEDLFVNFLTSWNTTIVGQLGASGAQNAIPPIPEWPTIDVPLGGTISRYGSTGFYSGILHDLASALVTYFTSINCDFKQHFRTASCYCSRGAQRVLRSCDTTAVDRRSTPSARADRQAPLPMFRCTGSPGFP